MKMRKILATVLTVAMVAQSSFITMAEEMVSTPEAVAETTVEAIEEAVVPEEVVVPEVEEITPEEVVAPEVVTPSEEVAVPEVTEETSEEKAPVLTDSTNNIVNATPVGDCIEVLDVSNIKTPHPYSNNAVYAWTIDRPGANYISITFDPQTYTENAEDLLYVESYKNNVSQESYIFSTDEAAGLTYMLPGDKVNISLGSNSSNNYWGFELVEGIAYYTDHDEKAVSTTETTEVRECTRCGAQRTVSIKYDITLSTSDTTSVTAKWNAKMYPEAEYVIYRSTDGKTYETLATKPAGTASYKDNTAIPGKAYYYKVYAKLNGKVKAKSSAKKITVKKLSTPANVKIGLASTGLKISYDKVNRASGYQVYFSTSEKGTYKSVKTTSDLSVIQTSGVTAGKAYYYKVRAYKTISGTKYYGSWSTPKKYTFKKPTLNKTTLTAYEKLTYTLKIDGGFGTTTWKSSDTSIATVSSKGVVTGKKAGTCKITATRNGAKITCTVTVKKNQKTYPVSLYLSDYTYGEPAISLSKVYYSGDKLVAEFYIINVSDYYIYDFTTWKLNLVDTNGNALASRTLKDYSVNLDSAEYRVVKITFSGTQVKNQKAKLYQGIDGNYEVNYTYGY